MSIFDESDVIYSYSRADALNDGELVDVTEWASHEKGFFGGFYVPVAFTRALYNTLEDIPEPEKESQDLRGRAHDVLFLAAAALRGAREIQESDATFEVIVATKENPLRLLELYVIAAPGDNGEPVVTIGYPADF